LKKLRDFLEEPVDDDVVEKIVKACHMAKVKTEKAAKMPPQMKEIYKNISKGGFSVYRKGNYYNILFGSCFKINTFRN